MNATAPVSFPHLAARKPMNLTVLLAMIVVGLGAAFPGYALDLVAFVARDAAGRRVVAEIRHIERYDTESDQVISDAWFRPDPVTGRPVRDSVIPVHLLDELAAHGYDPSLHEDGVGAWA